MKWSPEIEGFLQLGNTNARTEGYNRVIKQIKRVACGFRVRLECVHLQDLARKSARRRARNSRSRVRARLL
jgi:hypothetical protein